MLQESLSRRSLSQNSRSSLASIANNNDMEVLLEKIIAVNFRNKHYSKLRRI